MTHTKETIRNIVNGSIDTIIESITDKIYNKLNSTTCADKQNTEEISHNNSALMLDTTSLPIMDKQNLQSFVDDSGFINVATVLDEKVINLILEISACNGYLEIVKFLVKNGANINKTNALSDSAHDGHFEIVKFLVENGADINSTNALSCSACNGHFEIVKFLVENSADINTTFALYNSAHSGHYEIVKFLVENGADINSSYAFNSKYALPISAKNGHLEIVKFLVKEYVKKGIKIPNNCITKEVNDINKFLFFYTSADQYSLFNDEIVSSLAPVKHIII